MNIMRRYKYNLGDTVYIIVGKDYIREGEIVCRSERKNMILSIISYNVLLKQGLELDPLLEESVFPTKKIASKRLLRIKIKELLLKRSDYQRHKKALKKMYIESILEK